MFNDLWPHIQRIQTSSSSANNIYENCQCHRIHDLQISSTSLSPVSWKGSAGRKKKKRESTFEQVWHPLGLRVSDIYIAFPLPPISPAIWVKPVLKVQSSWGSQKGIATVGCQSLMRQHRLCTQTSRSPVNMWK